jgi:pyruvate formate lyase activating enzyme
MLGQTVTVDEVLHELLKDRAYYEKSGGGVTLSGGEPTFQPDFAEALLRALKEEGISTALDTCGLCTTQTLERFLPYSDLVLFDLKLIDLEAHRFFTGASNKQILENLDMIRNRIRANKQDTELWIRTPLIPAATATEGNLTAIGLHLAKELDGTVSRWELCAFNNLCRDQYNRLGMEWAYAKTPLMSRDELNHCEQTAKTSGFNPDLVFATGATRAG